MKNSVALAPIFEDKDKVEPIHKDKDGGGGDDTDLINVSVDIALNGYTLVYNYDDGSELKYVFTDFDEVLKHMKENH